mgnify:CR=1 FL=1
MADDDVIKQLLRNDVLLQKKMTELVGSINNLTKRVDGLVGIFEEAAKNVTSYSDNEEIKPLLDKLDSLTEQNKVIARGLIALEQYMREKQGRMMPGQFRPRPLT